MERIYIEERSLQDATLGEIARDIAYHLYTRSSDGCIYVVTYRPIVLLRLVRKKWLELTKMVLRERAKTLNGERIRHLTQQGERMQAMVFSTKTPAQDEKVQVSFIQPIQITEVINCHTMYVTCPMSDEKQQLLQKQVRPNGVLVFYQGLERDGIPPG